MLSCRFGQQRFCLGKPGLDRRPCRRIPRRGLPRHQTTSTTVARAIPALELGISPTPTPPRWLGSWASGRRPLTGVALSAHGGASGSAKGRLKQPPAGVSLRLQSVAPTESPYSKSDRLGTRSSRCSLDLLPLRGIRFDRWACALPSCACSTMSRSVRRRIASWLHGTTGYRSGRTWEPLRRPAPTSLGFSTSSDPRRP
jgi:hypothetical protein